MNLINYSNWIMCCYNNPKKLYNYQLNLILIIILFNCCANSFMIPEISVNEVTGKIQIESIHNDSLLIVCNN